MDADETGEPSIDVMPAHGGVGADVVAVLLDLILWNTGPVLSETVVAQRFQGHGLETTRMTQTVPPKSSWAFVCISDHLTDSRLMT